jgi:hypothetical protein
LKLRNIKGIIVFVIIVVVIVIFLQWGGVKLEIIGALIIGILIGRAEAIVKYFFGKSEVKSEEVITIREPKIEFEAEIVDKQPMYRRGQDVIIFRSKYKGKIKKGYFVNEICIKDTSIDRIGYRFYLTERNVKKDVTSVKSYCHDTIDNTTNYIGDLDDNISIDWKE